MGKTIDIRDRISATGLRVTPQRMRVLEAILKLNNHPTAENVIDFIRKNDPNIGSGTVYKVLQTFVDNKLIKRVKTERDIMRYDAILEDHHHLYCRECDHIEDFINERIDRILKDFFDENPIENFIIEDIKLNISGHFIIHKDQNH